MDKKRAIIALLACASLFSQSVALPLAGAEEAAGSPPAQTQTLPQDGKQSADENLKIENRVLLGYRDGYTLPENATLVVPPEVDTIADGAFMNQKNLSAVSFDKNATVSVIGKNAFAGTSITSFCAPDTLTTIGEGAFEQNVKLAAVDFSAAQGLKTIGRRAFAGTALVQVSIPRGASLGDEAFSGCSSLISVRVAADYTGTVGKDVFKNVASSAKIYVLSEAVKAKFAGKGINNANIVVEECVVRVSRDSWSIGAYASFDEAVAAIDALSPVIGELKIEIVKDVTIGQSGKLPSKASVITGAGGKLKIAADIELRADLAFKNITIDDAAGSSIYAGGHELLMAGGVVTSGKMSLYGGKKSGACESSEIMVMSGNYANITSGGNSGAAVTGNAVLHLSDNVKVSGKAFGGKAHTGGVSTVIFSGYDEISGLPVACEGFGQLTLQDTNVALDSVPFDAVSLTGSRLKLKNSAELADIYADGASAIMLAQGKRLTITNAAYPEENQKIRLEVDGTIADGDVLIVSAQPGVTANLFEVAGIPQGMHFTKVGDNCTVLSAAPVETENASVTAAGITFGESLASSALTLAGAFQYEGQDVAGTLAWKNPELAPEAGTFEAEWIFTPEQNWLESVSGTAQVAVARRQVTVTPNAGQFKMFGQDDPANYSYTADGLLDGMALQGSLTREEGEFAGLYKILQGGLTNEANPNFEINFTVDTVFEIKKAELKLETVVTPTAQNPGGSVDVAVKLTNPYKPEWIDGLPGKDEVTVTPEDGGTVTAEADADGYYRFAYALPTEIEDGIYLDLNINIPETAHYSAAAAQARVLATTRRITSLQFSADSETLVYGSQPEISAEISALDGGTQDELSGTVSVYLGADSQGEKLAEVSAADSGKIILDQKRLSAGVHEVYLEYSGDGAFAPSHAAGTITIAKKDLTVKPESIWMRRGGQLPAEEDIAILYDGFIEGENEATPGVLEIKDAFRAVLPDDVDTGRQGSYIISLVGEADSENYNIIKENSVLTIASSGSTGTTATRYLIRASCTAGGTISPKGLYQLVLGASKTYKITPDKGYEIEDVIVNGKSVGAVSSYTYKAYSNGTIVAKFRDKSEPAVEKFTDIRTHWAREDIEYVVEHGYFNGVSSSRFAPDDKITRAMVVTVLGRLDDCETDSVSAFDDVSRSAYYSPYVAWAEKYGIVNGVGDNLFDPDRAISRQEMAVIFGRYLDYCDEELPSSNAAVSSFRDKRKIAYWAENDVDLMRRAGIINGRDDNTFDPEGTATRAEFAAILRRLIEKLDW